MSDQPKTNYEIEERSQDIVCPFCQEGDFDLIGLKIHFLRGHCDEFNTTEDRTL